MWYPETQRSTVRSNIGELKACVCGHLLGARRICAAQESNYIIAAATQCLRRMHNLTGLISKPPPPAVLAITS